MEKSQLAVVIIIIVRYLCITGMVIAFILKK